MMQLHTITFMPPLPGLTTDLFPRYSVGFAPTAT